MAITASERHHIALGATQPASAQQSKGMHVLLWVIQGLLAALFVFAGAMKFIMPAEEMTKNSPLPLGFLYFIGVAELLGGLGLVLPGLFHIRERLTPLAAAGLTVIMVGAVCVSAPLGLSAALIPLVVGLLSAFVAYRRWKPAA